MRNGRSGLNYGLNYGFYFGILFCVVLLALTVSAQKKPAGDGSRSVITAKPNSPIKTSPTANIKQLPEQAKRYAVVIGVDKYDDPQVTPLSGAGNDARSLANALVVNAGFPREQVFVMTSGQAAERKPTRGNILRRLSTLAGVLPKDGLFLFAFAGHGIERDGRAFLLPADAQISDNIKLLEQTAIDVTTIKESIKNTGIKQVLLVLDACRNDPTAGRGVERPNPLGKPYLQGFNFDVKNKEVTAFATIYATQVGQRAYEYSEKKQGYFTYAVVEALQGAAANEQGEVTLAGLVNYLQQKVPQKVALDLGKGKEQKPFAVIEGYNAADLIVAVKGVVTGVLLPPPATTEISGTTNENLSGTIWVGNSPETGEFIWEFMPDGKLKQSFEGIKNGAKTTMTALGTWKQSGKTIQISFGYSVMTGKIDDGVLKLKGTNIEGVDFARTLLPKMP